MPQTKEERLKLAVSAAEHSARISGADTSPKSESFKIHLELMRSVMGCETRVLVHPVIFNSPLCGHPHEARYRTGLRASARGIIPAAPKVRPILDEWWKIQLKLVAGALEYDEDFRERIAWQIHDFFISLEPFAEANARTARLLFYSCLIALRLPVKLITMEKAAEYAENQRRFRQQVFMPLMLSQGHLD